MSNLSLRVYELSKELGISTKDALSILVEGKFDVKNHMSVIPEGGAEFLQKKIKGGSAKTMSSSKAPVAQPEKRMSDSSAAKTVSSHSNNAQKNDSLKKVSPVQSSQDVSEDSSGNLGVRKGTANRPSIRYGAHSTFTGEEYIEESDPSTLPGARPFRRRKSSFRRGRNRQHNVQEILPDVKEITVSGGVMLSELAVMMGKPTGLLILELLKKGLACTMNDIVPVSRIQELATVLEIGVKVIAPVSSDIGGAERSAQIRNVGSNLVRRWPVVVVMGHVDHGKTTLLDYLRKTSVAAKEKGGITQHLGAYEVESSHGKIVFIDTPGHAAFTALRDRGVSVTDLVVLIVSVDDGVKPQTLEALKQAKLAKLPIIVAINKIDKSHSQDDFDRIKRQLAEQDLLAEDWGGNTIMVGISAKTGQGVDELLEMIVLQSQLMDIFADVAVPAKLFVLEFRFDRVFVAIATVIPLCGTLKVGDYVASEHVTGKIRLLIKPSGDRVAEVGPSIPVQIIGCNVLPSPGDVLTVVSQDEYAEAKSSQVPKGTGALSTTTNTQVVDEESDGKSLKVMIKADTQGSADAIMKLILQLSEKDPEVAKRLRVLGCSVGDVTGSDILRSVDTGSMIIAFNVRIDRNAIEASQGKKVVIKPFDVIYHLTEYLEAEILRTKKAIKVTRRTGQLEVRKIFVLKDRGIIAGCYVTEGTIQRNGRVVGMRGKQKIGSDEISSLQRDKKSVKEVATGYECAFMCKDFHGWQVGDMVECFVDELV